MAVSAEVVREHIRTWTGRLRNSPKLANWPAHLFHAADILNAVQILAAGRLVCRRDLPEIPSDVANQEALRNNPEAHSFVRLYFRPKTNFHLRTEGIKCLDDPYRLDHQMSIPIMFAFDAESILTRPGVGCSEGMLSKKRPIGFKEEAFLAIDFAGVYHDGPVPKDQMKEIQDKRMAEVVVPGELPLVPFLRKVICRTPLERRTLLHLLGPQAARLASLTAVEQLQQSTFLHRELYLTSLSFRQGALELRFHHPSAAPRSGKYLVEVEQRIEGQSAQRWTGEIPSEWPGVQIPALRPIEGGSWKILLEGVLAYEAPIPTRTSVLR